MTRFGRRREPLEALLLEALDALERAGPLLPLDAVLVGTMNAEEFAGSGNLATFVTDAVGASGVPALRLETASSSGAALVHEAAWRIRSGRARRVLCLAGEKMAGHSTPETTRILAEVLAREERQCGASMPALAALCARRYLHEFHAKPEVFSEVAVKAHANAVRNPYAHFQEPITLEQARESRLVADPLRLYDCSPISDGACAAVVAEAGPVRIAGLGQATDVLPLQDRDALTSFAATRAAASEAFALARCRPAEISVAEVHDAFTPFELIGAEDLGLFKPGGAAEATSSGETALGGRLPINPSGGLKARGHPVGASGLAQLIELFWQLTGEAGGRQIDGARLAVAHSLGGFANNNFVTVVERA